MSTLSLNRDRITAFLMLLPSVILLAIFVYGFIGRTAYDSLTDWEGVAENVQAEVIGLDNYDKLFTGLLDVRFRQSLVNTFYFTLFFMLGCLGLGMFLAVLLDQNVRFEGAFRLIFLFPMSLSFIVSGTVWRWLFNPKGGINRLPTLIGLDPLKNRWLTDREQLWRFNWQDTPTMAAIAVALLLAFVAWRYLRRGHKLVPYILAIPALLILVWALLGDPDATQTSEYPTLIQALLGDPDATQISKHPALIQVLLKGPNAIQTTEYEEPHGFNMALVGLIIAAVWQMSGYTMAMYLAGIRGIPEELREAARVDGANEFQVYRRIILPMLQPITLSAMIVLGHISLKIFDLVFVMAGPDNATTDVPGTLMFTTSFRANQFAKGAGIAIVMLVMVAVVIVPYLVVTLRSETEL